MRQGPYPNIVAQADSLVDDSDKTFTVPVGREWRLQMLSTSLVSSAVVGNRQLKVEIGDGANLLWSKSFGAVQAASLTRRYMGAADLPDDVAFDADGNIRMQLSGWVLPTGCTVRVYDSAAIDATHDDMTVRLLVEEMRE